MLDKVKDPDELNNANWWIEALDRVAAGQDVPGIDANNPAYGYYQVKRKGRTEFSPVAYWYDRKTGELRCHMDGQDFDLQRSIEIWPYAANRPVTYEAYGERLRTGKWPNENAVLKGHNQAPADDSIEAITERIDDLAREAERLIAENAEGAKSKDIADQASDIAQTLGQLAIKTADLHAEEKRPILEAGREVDRKWFSLKDRASELKVKLKHVVLTPWLTKAQEEAEKSAAEKIAQGAEPSSVSQPRTTAGANKRATALRTHFRAEVEDRAALLEHLKEHPEVLACIQKIADAAAKSKIALPGCKVIAEKRAA